MICPRRSIAIAFVMYVFIDLERKLRARRRLGTVVVSTANTADQGLESVAVRLFQHLARNWSIWVSGVVWSQGRNLKELTLGHHKAWSLRLNLTQRGEAY